MKKILLMIVMAMTAFVTSCKEENDSKQMNQVMAVHDEVMPKMGQLGKLVGELKEKENDSTDIGKSYKEARMELQDANQTMMDWMQNFGKRFTPDEILNGAALSDQKKQWLNEEEEKAKAMRDKVNSSIANAENVLGK